VLHFLGADAEGGTLSTADIAETVAKVVRELGQPALARAYLDRKGKASERVDPTKPVSVQFTPSQPLSAVLAECRRAYARSAVFTRDLVAAQHDGLLTIDGRDAPLELAASALVPLTPLLERLLEARQHTAGSVALDGADHALAQKGTVSDLVRELEVGLRGTELRAVVNLNTATAPAWADDLADGPLFTEQRSTIASDRFSVLADALLSALAHGSAPIRIDYHLSERDFAPESAERLLLPIRLAGEGAPVAFVFDRPRRPVALAEGIDRKHPALLLTVGLHLPRLAAMPGVSTNPELFLQKLGSLARLALSAAEQKRDFLRRHAADRPALTRGFYLDRARLMVAPLGLDAAVKLLTGTGMCDHKTPEFGRQVIQRLRDVLREDGRTCVIDVPGGISFDPSALVKTQLRAAGPLHAIAEGGTVVVAPDGEHLAEWLRMAWSQTEVGRICFLRRAPTAPLQLGLT
jgi:hypothetical protein